MDIKYISYQILAHGLKNVNPLNLPKFLQPEFINGMISYYESQKETKLNHLDLPEIRKEIKSAIINILCKS